MFVCSVWTATEKWKVSRSQVTAMSSRSTLDFDPGLTGLGRACEYQDGWWWGWGGQLDRECRLKKMESRTRRKRGKAGGLG